MKILRNVALVGAVLTDSSGCGSAIFYRATHSVPMWPMIPFLLGMFMFATCVIIAGITAIVGEMK